MQERAKLKRKIKLSTVDYSFSAYNRDAAACLAKAQPGGLLDPMKCEMMMQLGFFFDGTNNNQDRDFPSFSHSNISRLAMAYPADTTRGVKSTYIPGVGTPFPTIGDMDDSTLGTGFAIGCEGRVLFAMLDLLNSVHRHLFSDEAFFSDREIKALCCGHLLPDAEDSRVLARMGFSTNLFPVGARQKFFESRIGMLKLKMGRIKGPVIKECFVDVFGFSRGAAEARVFCSWLDKILHEGMLVDIKVRIRFLGIFDTVASAGFWNGVANSAINRTDGHSGWAAPEFLVVPKLVENCVHLLAMHELRKNFPLDEIGENGILPSGHVQLAYPGSHSDVGGGYSPGELGISVGKSELESDALKLSQIPLNHMFDFAVAAGVPLSKRRAYDRNRNHDPFLVAAEVNQAFSGFLRESGDRVRSMREWMQPYLNWRWQVREQYASTMHVRRANDFDRKLLVMANRKLIEDANLLLGSSLAAGSADKTAPVLARTIAKARSMTPKNAVWLLYVDEEAPRVLAEARAAPPISKSLAAFFDSFVHDSYAGFTKDLTEPTGYWRHRKSFKGSARIFSG